MGNPDYGAKQQWITNNDDGPQLPPEGIQKIQQVVGKLLFYGKAVDPTMQITL